MVWHLRLTGQSDAPMFLFPNLWWCIRSPNCPCDHTSRLQNSWRQMLFNDGTIEQPKTIQALSYDAGVREQPKSLCKSICQRARPPHTTPPKPKPEPQQSISISSLHPDRVHQEKRHQRVSAIFITRSMMWAHNITSLPHSNLSVCLSLHLHSSVTPGGGCHRGNFVLSTVFSLSERFLSLLLTPSVKFAEIFFTSYSCRASFWTLFVHLDTLWTIYRPSRCSPLTDSHHVKWCLSTFQRHAMKCIHKVHLNRV